jgi:membrane fusion protein (multidrug efflux system)
VAEVIQQDVPIYFEWVGTTDGYVNVQIRPCVQGYLYARHYREGSVIKAGDLMFTIDPRGYQAALDQARGNLAQAEANLGKTQLDVARYTPLAKEGASADRNSTMLYRPTRRIKRQWKQPVRLLNRPNSTSAGPK